MARAHFIYLVRHNDRLIGCFTVKHEANRWAARYCRENAILPTALTLWRTPDGIQPKGEVQVNWQFEEMGLL